MKAPPAWVSHQVQGRVRIQIPSKRSSHSYFSSLERLLFKHVGIDAVRSNPALGSVLILHQTDIEAIRIFAMEHDLFLLADGKTARERRASDWRKDASQALDQLDRSLEGSTQGELNLSTVRLIGLLTVGVFQLYRGRLFPPAWTLFENALGQLRRFEVPKETGSESKERLFTRAS